MRFFIYIVSCCLLATAMAGEEYSSIEVWLEGSSFYESIHPETKPTLYYETWDLTIDTHRKNGDAYLAIQLDENFDPLPKDQLHLPNLSLCAAISSEEVVHEYLTFLEQYSRTQGISYLILPDTSGFSPFEKELLKKANTLSPHFYLKRNLLTNAIPHSKKEFLHHTGQTPHIWIASQETNLKKFRKWNDRLSSEEHLRFADELRQAREKKFSPVMKISDGLRGSLIHHATYALDTDARLPIMDRDVVYLGNNEELKFWLSKYANVGSVRKEGVITIVDKVSIENLQVQPGDIVISTEIENESDITQLVLPLNYTMKEILVCKMMFGVEEIKGRYEGANNKKNLKYLGFSSPEEQGLGGSFIHQFDSIGRSAINHYATPGMQVSVVKGGSFVYEKSMGYYTYDSIKPINEETIYDVASLTKVMATLPAIALLIDRGELSLEDSIGQYLEDFSGSNKEGITIKELLAHNAGLKSYMPFWSMMMDGDRMDPFYYKNKEDEENDIRSYGFEPHPSMQDTLRSFIVQSDLMEDTEAYRYSDLGFMILHLVVEKITNMPFDEFLQEEFYQPMGLSNTTFNPLKNGFEYESITPTEYDHRFRSYQVWGEVHDRNAAVFGGVSGHAGLFSNATDLAKMMSMFLNEGYYGGRRYISANTLGHFNTRHFTNNRRGLGWDKKGDSYDVVSKLASDVSFGHTGFTGAMVWADPEQDLIFIFLSNRVFPDANNNRLSTFKTRAQMHDILYKSIHSENTLKLN